MIISHKHKYLFVALPRSGSTAIQKELRTFYDGQPILRKHSTYRDFLKIASPEEKQYFTFSCIRNPLDDIVSVYSKLASNHSVRYTDPNKIRSRTTIAEKLENRMFRYLQRTNGSFQDFFKKYYMLPYGNWAVLDHKRLDFVIRFENLQEDFDTALRKLDVEPVRKLPVRNKTSLRSSDYADYYSPDIARRANRICGPFMQEWGYEFPDEWGDVRVSKWNQMTYRMTNLFRMFYWLHLRYRI